HEIIGATNFNQIFEMGAVAIVGAWDFGTRVAPLPKRKIVFQHHVIEQFVDADAHGVVVGLHQTVEQRRNLFALLQHSLLEFGNGSAASWASHIVEKQFVAAVFNSKVYGGYVRNPNVHV